jgi:hypothetical protein
VAAEEVVEEGVKKQIQALEEDNLKLYHVRWTISRCTAKTNKKFTSTRLIGANLFQRPIGENLRLFLAWEMGLKSFSEERSRISDAKIIYFHWLMRGKFEFFIFIITNSCIFHGKIYNQFFKILITLNLLIFW